MIDRRSLAVMGGVLLATAAQAAPVPGRDTILAQTGEARRRFAEILFTRDHAALPGLFTADTLVLPAGRPLVRGRDAAIAFWTAATSNPARRLRSQFDLVDQIIEGPLVIETGLATVSAVEEGREQVIDHGKYILVWKWEDGRWKRHRDIFNSDAPKA
ncbi:nuclear transport factor 2 family protein [Niveispirillum sp.]|uniref:YybH family protein n=1 Tax=Niveispirillum sp. TaxID=1917217 RepID=UPI001B5DD394|nr:nuclear transport factor 2 family protein [Niveispirillum sp.]MBP7334335.1 nuclear transport factor 2 family protein [Niveispirillum sp.]